MTVPNQLHDPELEHTCVFQLERGRKVEVIEHGKVRGWLVCRGCRRAATPHEAARWAFRKLGLPPRCAPQIIRLEAPAPTMEAQGLKAALTDLQKQVVERDQALFEISGSLKANTEMMGRLRAQLKTALGEKDALEQENKWLRSKT